MSRETGSIVTGLVDVFVPVVVSCLALSVVSLVVSGFRPPKEKEGASVFVSLEAVVSAGLLPKLKAGFESTLVSDVLLSAGLLPKLNAGFESSLVSDDLLSVGFAPNENAGLGSALFSEVLDPKAKDGFDSDFDPSVLLSNEKAALEADLVSSVLLPKENPGLDSVSSAFVFKDPRENPILEAGLDSSVLDPRENPLLVSSLLLPDLTLNAKPCLLSGLSLEGLEGSGATGFDPKLKAGLPACSVPEGFAPKENAGLASVGLSSVFEPNENPVFAPEVFSSGFDPRLSEKLGLLASPAAEPKLNPEVAPAGFVSVWFPPKSDVAFVLGFEVSVGLAEVVKLDVEVVLAPNIGLEALTLGVVVIALFPDSPKLKAGFASVFCSGCVPNENPLLG